MHGYFARVRVCAVGWQKLKEGVGCPGTDVMDACEPLCEWWASNPGPLKKQQVLQTTKPSLQPLDLY